MGKKTKEVLLEKVHRKKAKKVTLVIGKQEIRTITVYEEYIFKFSDDSPINSLVRSIHRTVRTSENGPRTELYYRDCYNHAVAVMNDSIINLFANLNETNIFVTYCGIILIWGKYELYSTIDMQKLNFHEELDEVGFFKHYEICDIFSNEAGKDSIRLKLHGHPGWIELLLLSEVNLNPRRSKCSTKVFLPEIKDSTKKHHRYSNKDKK